MIAPQPKFYPNHETEFWVLFDSRVPSAGSRMRREARAWKACASVERVDEDHAVLIVRLGGARELAR